MKWEKQKKKKTKGKSLEEKKSWKNLHFSKEERV